jgi:hypothetical protein
MVILKRGSYFGKSLRIFISYAINDKVAAGALKDILESMYLEVFLAHDDIQPTEEWRERILRELESCDVFLPLLTNDFRKSQWTDQEVGFALANGKVIVSLKVEIDPYGFLGKYQAMKHDSDNPKGTAEKLMVVLAGKKETQEAVKDCLIKTYAESVTFKEANSNTQLLKKTIDLSGLNRIQINEVIVAASFNDQIYHGTKAFPFAREIYSKHKSQLMPSLKRAFENTVKWIESQHTEGQSPAQYVETYKRENSEAPPA